MNPESVNVDEIKVTEKESKLWIKYEKKPLRIKTGDIELKEGGITPYINPKTKKPFTEYPNGKDDFRRYNINIPVEGELNKLMKSLDSMMKGYDELEELEGLEFSKCVREGDPETQYHTKDKINVKFRSEFETNKITTVVYKPEKGKPKEVTINKFSDVEKLIKLGSVVNLVLVINKIWVTETKYGLNIECEQIYVKPKEVVKEKIVCAFD